jgi:hypothetical protein
MRNLAILVMLLALAKLGLHELNYRRSTSELIVSGYQGHAAESCQQHARSDARGGTIAWSKPEAVSLRVGRSNVNVWIWQVGEPSWQTRYRNPYLVLQARDQTSRLTCEYDIVNGQATIYRM